MQNNCRIVLTDKLAGAATIAKFVRMVSPGHTTADALVIARTLQAGGVWETNDGSVIYHLSLLAQGAAPWEYTVIPDPNPLRDEFEARQAEYAHGVELADLGAEGDAVAAIRFCKLFNAGVMDNYCMG